MSGYNKFTYKWQPQQYISWKGYSRTEAVPGNARPLTNGTWILNQPDGMNQTDGNAFLPRPIKHWRRQLQSDPTRGGTIAKNIHEVFQPGGTIYLGGNPNEKNECCDNDNKTGFNIISNISIDKNNKFCNDINCAYTVTAEDVLENGWNGPIGKQICCNPVYNIIKPATTLLSKKYYTDSRAYLRSRSKLYNQKLTNLPYPGVTYYGEDGKWLYPDNSILGPQVFSTGECPQNACNGSQQITIFKPNNRSFKVQGAVESSTRLEKLKLETVTKSGASLRRIFGDSAAKAGSYYLNGNSPYLVKNNYVPPECCSEPPPRPQVNGTFIYQFDNDNIAYSRNIIFNNNRTFYSKNLNSVPIPIISTNDMTYTYEVENIDSITKVTVNYTFYTDNENTNDGLSFYSADSSIVNFYNALGGNLTIIQFGDIPLSKGGNQFSNLNNLIFDSGSGVPTMPFFGTSLINCFSNTNFNSDVSSLDVSNVTTMENMFKSASTFNQNLNSWDVSNVTNMTFMFNLATAFNNGEVSLATWSAPLCTSFFGMFQSATAFNQPIPNLVNTSGVALSSLAAMFSGATIFNQNVGAWDVSNVQDMTSIFRNTNAFNNGGFDMNNWDVSNANDMTNIFNSAIAFNNGGAPGTSSAPLTWYAPLCKSFVAMFGRASAFNQQLPNLVNTSGVASCNMNAMFNSLTGANTTLFNQNISSWDVSNVTNMGSMFFQASNFNNGEINTLSSVTPSTCTSTSTTLNCPGATLLSLVSVGDALLIPNSSRISAFVVTNVNSNTQLTISPSIGTNTAGQIFNVQKVIPITSTLTSVTPSTSSYLNSTKTLTCPGASFQSPSPPINVNDTLWVVTTTIIFITTVQSITDNENLVVTGFGTNIVSGTILNIQKPPTGTNPLTWDTSNLTITNNMFRNAAIFNQSLSTWDTSNVTDMAEMFRSTSSFNQPLSTFNTSSLTNVGGMFNEAKMFNQPINTNGPYWNMSNVTNMGSVFQAAQIFNQNINNWDTSKVTIMNTLFFNAFLFNEQLNSWDVSKVTNMNSTFQNAYTFNNGGLPGTSLVPLTWYAPLCTAFASMFARANAFNQPLPNLVNTTIVTSCDMTSMFVRVSTSPFNQNLNSWVVSNVTNMTSMFQGTTSFNNGGVALTWSAPNCISFTSMFQSTTAFNQPITTLVNTSGLIAGVACSLASMFQSATTFNQNIGGWDVTNVNTMQSTFQSAPRFNQDISAWGGKLVNVTNMSAMFQNASDFNNGDTSGSSNNPLTSWNAPKCVNFSLMFRSAPSFNQDISNLVSMPSNIIPNITPSTSSYTNSTRILNCPGATFTTTLVGQMSIIIQTSSITYISNISSITNDENLVVVTAIGSNIGVGSIISITINNTLSLMFNGASTFNQNISEWNTLNVTDMSSMFNGASTFNNRGVSLASWSAPLCTSFANMFQSASAFNQPLTNLVNTSVLISPSVCAMNSMFVSAIAFNQNIGSWGVSRATPMNNMFQSATAFNNGGSPDIQNWTAPLCTTFASMFQSATVFNQPLQNLGTGTKLVNTSGLTTSSSVCAMNSMFVSAIAFNQNIGSWDVSRATPMNNMFQSATAFNNGGSPDIQNWTAPLCTTFASMFNSATSFNQPLQNLGTGTKLVDTSVLTGTCSLTSMFQSATLFNQNIGSWKLSKVATLTNMFTLSRDFNNGGSNTIQDWSAPLCTSFASMFSSTSAFNQPLTNLVDTTSLGVASCSLASMFQSAILFNKNIGSWNTSNVTTMASMFSGTTTLATTTTFNNGQASGTVPGTAPLNWNTSRVTTMANMFQYCVAFNQPIGANGAYWNTPLVTTVVSMFQGINGTTGIHLFNNGKGALDETAPLNWTFNVLPTSTSYRLNSRLTRNVTTFNNAKTTPQLPA